MDGTEDTFEEPTALQLADTEDLIDELVTRFDNGILCLGRAPVGEDDISEFGRFFGEYYTILGMCEETKRRIIDALCYEDDDEEEYDGSNL